MITKRAVLFNFFFVTFQLVFHVDLKTIYLIGTSLEVQIISKRADALTGYFQEIEGVCKEVTASHLFQKNNPLIFVLSQINIILPQNALENVS